MKTALFSLLAVGLAACASAPPEAEAPAQGLMSNAIFRDALIAASIP